MSVTTRTLSPDEITHLLPDLAKLRIRVFRDWPYLYDGSMEYEMSYLAPYAQSPSALVAGAWHGDQLVGAATAAPMEDHADDFGRPLTEAGYRLEDILYFGESVLLPTFRGQGVGHAFFDHREAKARALGRRFACFCSVVRPTWHPMRPTSYRPLDAFWRKRGYKPMPGIEAEFGWRDVGDGTETTKPMQVWMRALDG
jgi:GNAT superfamily N-acetyltransferase